MEQKSYTQGLEQVVTDVATADKRQGTPVETRKCHRCGTVSSYFVGKDTKCNGCGASERDAHRVEAVIDSGKVDAIINRTVAYKCPTCLRLYDTPTPCCVLDNASMTLQDSLEAKKGAAKPAYYCTGCKTVYYRKPKHECCTGSKMIKGKAFKATRDEYMAMPKLLKPIW